MSTGHPDRVYEPRREGRFWWQIGLPHKVHRPLEVEDEVEEVEAEVEEMKPHTLSEAEEMEGDELSSDDDILGLPLGPDPQDGVQHAEMLDAEEQEGEEVTSPPPPPAEG